MANPFVAEIRIFPFNFAPSGWAFCNGQLLPLSQNTALFSLLGTTYGGDGRSTFALPNMQGNAPLHAGQGPGLSLYDLGENGGSTTVTLNQSEIPMHTHNLTGDVSPATDTTPAGGLASYARLPSGDAYKNTTTGVTPMNVNAIAFAGGGLPHNNMMPYLTLNFCIAMQGVFPPRT
jgi:microcystin-dependent protein